jgi:FkbH-like protein
MTDHSETLPLPGTVGRTDLLGPLRAAADPTAPFFSQATLARRLKKILPEVPNLRPLRIAVLGNGTLDLFAEVLRLWLVLEGFRPEIYLGAYGAFRQEILDSQSALYEFRPDTVWLFATGRDVCFPEVVFGADASVCEAAITTAASEWRNWWRRLRTERPIPIIQNNFESPAVRVFGHYDAVVPWSRTNLIHRLNLVLSEAVRGDNVALFDLAHDASTFGLSRWHEERHWHQSKQPFAPDAFGLVAFHAARFLGAMKGTARKCVVLDLDNTLWGGVIGDDGLEGILLGNGPEGEAFVAFQDYLLSLRARGILLAICSKNDTAIAREAFLKHPAMRVQLQDIAVFCANWENKVDNLRQIAATLNIGLDTLVFVDDNPIERELVRSALPEVAVPEMPSDPAEYVEVLAAGRFFEALSFSPVDVARTRLYRENAQREAARAATTDITNFLRDLDMEADNGPADAFHLPRMAQLLARTNQFHPTTTRHSEAELAALAADSRGWVRWFSLRDRFGDHGLVSVVVLQSEGNALAIDSWVMSCRVFSRGLEELVFLEMVRAARKLEVTRLIGRYRPTSKNRPVADLFQRMGFTLDGVEEEGTRWILDLSSPIPDLSPFIRWRSPGLPT